MSAAAAAPAKPKAHKTWVAKTGELKQKWYIVDAANQSLGRLSVPIAMRLMGKDKPTYTPHVDTGDFVVVINAEKIKIHPKKYEAKTYQKWSGYPGGLRVRTLAEEQAKNPATIIRESVRRMLPKTLLGKVMLSKLKIYAGKDHPHTSQKPEAWKPLA
ncbi:MAG TPA: 50S ribosomal protein L13 [Planctomycetota bacterium]|nr:50S ribosomal protein L13 [Planctomycetota bacterium]